MQVESVYTSASNSRKTCPTIPAAEVMAWVAWPAIMTVIFSSLVSCCIELPDFEAWIKTMIDWSSCPSVERDPQRVSGAWVFLGTRVPVAALFENLEDGAQLSDFIEWFPGVTLQQARTVLEHATRSLEVT